LASRSFSSRLKRYSVVGRGEGCWSRCVTGGGSVVVTDTPRSDGGGGSAAEPVETLLSALIGCEQATAHFVSRMLRPRLRIDRIEFLLEAERDTAGSSHLPVTVTPPVAAALKCIKGSAKVHVKDPATPADIHRLGDIVAKRCPVAALLNCPLHIDWILADDNDDETK